MRQDDCQPFRVQNLGTNFRPDQDRQTINIGVDVWDSTGRQRLNGAVDNVTLVNAADPEIRVTPGAIPLNGTATFNVTLGGDVVPTAYRCLWSVTGLQQQPHADGSNNDCKDFKFHAPADMADPEQGRLLVELRLLARSMHEGKHSSVTLIGCSRFGCNRQQPAWEIVVAAAGLSGRDWVGAGG